MLVVLGVLLCALCLRSQATAPATDTTNQTQALNAWSPAQPQIARHSHAMASVDGWAVSFGGLNWHGVRDSTWVRKEGSAAWARVELEPRPTARLGAGLASLMDGRAVLFGGQGQDSGCFNDTWVLTHRRDSGDWAWAVQAVKGSPSARTYHAMAGLQKPTADGALEVVVVLFGGLLSSGVESGETWVLTEPTNGSFAWRPAFIEPAPSARAYHGLAALGGGLGVLFGGRQNWVALNDTWVFSASTLTWDAVETGPVPPSRTRFAMAAVSEASKQVVVFGGNADTTLLQSTWVFSGTTRKWTEFTASEKTPSKGFNSRMVTLEEGKALLFGGFDNQDMSGETWEFTMRGGWRQLVSTVIPEAKEQHVLAAPRSPDTPRAIMFGGLDWLGIDTNDTWLLRFDTNRDYRNANWTRVHHSSQARAHRTLQGLREGYPSSRHAYCMAGITASAVLLFGGAEGSVYLNDTWVFDFDDEAWFEVDAGGRAQDGPLPRIQHQITSNALGEVVLFGGLTADAPVDDTWLFCLSTTTWTRLDTPIAPSPRWSHQMASWNDTVVLFGGMLTDEMLAGDTWVLRVNGADQGEWSHAMKRWPNDRSPRPRTGHAMTGVCCNKVVLFGGLGEGGYLDDLWVLSMNTSDPSLWVWQELRQASFFPPSRAFHSIATLYNNRVMIHGGMLYEHAFVYRDAWTLLLGCPPGHAMTSEDFSMAQCVECPPGKFMPSDNRAQTCLSCNASRLTPYGGASSEDQCEVCNPEACGGQGCGLSASGGLLCLCARGHFGHSCQFTCPGGAENPCHGYGKCSDDAHGTGKCICQWWLFPFEWSGDCARPTGLICLATLLLGVVLAKVVVRVSKSRRRVMDDLGRYRVMLLSSEEEVAAGETQVTELQRSWKIRPTDLTLVECVGQGSFAQVWRGRWSLLDKDVAIKKMLPLPSQIDDNRPPMFDDAEVECFLRTRGHPRLVLFFGVSTVCESDMRLLLVVTEFMAGGSLQDILEQAHRGERSFTWAQRLQCACDIAQGMEHLHDLGYLHRDLKSPNVLCDGRGRFKVADFGLARRWREAHDSSAVWYSALVARARGGLAKRDTPGSLGTHVPEDELLGPPLTGNQGSLEWMAPELFRPTDPNSAGLAYNHKVDVYAFGVVLWELLVCTGASPWAHLDRVSDIKGAVLRGDRPPVTAASLASAPAGFHELLLKCWHQEPNKRPSFPRILRKLNAMLPTS